MTQDIEIAVDGAVMALRLNRPEKKNAITVAMYGVLAEGLERAASDPDILVVTISGEGETFTSGNDLKDFQAANEGGADMTVFSFLKNLSSFPKPVIAAARGQAIGIGTTMLLHCDLVLATPNASFLMPFVDLALVPEAASSMLLPRLIGRQRAAQHLLLAEPFDAQTARSYGIVTHVVPEPELDERLRDMAARLSAKPPEAVRLTKQLILSPEEPVQSRIEREGDHFAERLRSAEAAEAFAAFFQKRPPNFTRR